MYSWIGVRLACTTVWLGAFAVAGAASELARPPSPTGMAAVAPGSAWLPWLGVAAAGVLVGLGFLWWRNRRMERGLGRRSLEFSFGEKRYHTLFDNTPVQILEEDLTAVAKACARLRAEGVTNLMNHLKARPNLQRELRGLVRLRDANRPAVAAAGFAGKPEMIAQFSRLEVAPYPEVFDYQLEALWLKRQQLEEEFRYLDANGQERACLMLCRVNERDGQPDLSRVTLVLLDITTAKRTVTAQMENQELMRQILARANILLWWARVRREGGHIRWKINVPSQSYDSPLFQLATARDRGGLWEIDYAPDLPETSRRAEQALLNNSPGYRQEFRVLSKDGVTHWLSEEVGISRLGQDDWSLIGVVTDVTAQHAAEEEQKKSQAQLQEILARADCLLWQARVLRVGDQLQWERFRLLDSPLYSRIFGTKYHGAENEFCWTPANVPEAPEMDRRSRAAILAGAPGYEQEFRFVQPERTLWLHEQVSITSDGPDQWNLVGVLMDVTAQHEAEEARKASEARLRQILTREDCMLWQARVTESDGQFLWDAEVPPSGLQKRIFGGDAGVKHKGVSGIKAKSLLSDFIVPEQAEMDACGLGALRSGAPGYELAYRVIKGNQTFWLQERVSITPVRSGQWDLVGITIDVSAQHEAEEARKASEAQLEQILARADCMLWRASVVRQGAGLLWRSFDLPASGLYTRLKKAGVIPGDGRLWPKEFVPERSAMDARAARAILSGAPGYEQEFHIIKGEQSFWLHEQVMIAPAGPDEWNLVGVLMDVTAQHEAEEARKATELQLRQTLERADCLLWQARVVRVADGFQWDHFKVPGSPLHQRIFGTEHHRSEHELWTLVNVPEMAEMNARSSAALLAGAPGYEQEFSVVQPERTLWLLERVSITAVGRDEWAVFGVLIDVTARHEAEEARKTSEAQLGQILRRADCMLWQAQVVEDAAGVLNWILYIPRSILYRELFGDDPSEHPNFMWSELNVPELTEMNARSTAAIRRGAPGYEQEFRAVREGRPFWLHEQVSITLLGPGKWSLVGIITNVTARREAEEARKASEAQLRQILTRADCLIWQANVRREGGELVWRKFAMPSSVLCQRLFGPNPPTTGTGLWFPEDTPDLAEMTRRSTEAILSGAPGYEQEFSLIRSEGTLWLHEQVSITPIGPDEWNLVGVLMDVTAQREAEKARRTTEAQLQQILDRADCMLWRASVTDVDGKISWLFDVPASGLQRRIFGSEGLVGSPVLYENFTVPEIAEMYVLGAAALRGGAPGYEHEFRIVKPDRTYWLHERATITPQGPGRWLVFGLVIDISALKEAEQVIRASEARYRDLFESAVEGVYQTTPDGRFVSVNPSLARIFGCATPAEFLAWPEAKAESLYIKPGRRAEFFIVLEGRDSVTNFESEVRCRDGTTKWISEDVRAVRDADGGLLSFRGSVSDVTERRKALEALRESEARYRALFENIPVAILELDFRDIGQRLQELHAAGVQDLSAYLSAHPEELVALKEQVRVAAVNETAVRQYQAESKQPFQSGLSRLFAADVLRVLQLFLESIWQGRNDGEAELATEDFVGRRHHTYLRWWMPRSSEGLKAGYAVVAAVDLSELKRAEAALAAEKERLAVTLRAMTEGVITTDIQGVVQFMNRAAAELAQQEAAGVVGRPISEVCAFKDTRSGQSVSLPAARVLTEGTLVDLPPHTSLVGRNGATCLVEGCCVPVRDADSELVGMVLVLRDVTVRQRFEEELQRASRLESIGILAGGIAHDFNNILTAIMGNITLALLDGEAFTKVERYLRDAERATLRARDLTQQLLTFAKGGDPVRTAVLLPEIITEVAQFALHGSRVKCEFDLPAGLWLADADKGQLGQVVQNLVINATQAMPEGGSIRIRARNESVTIDPRRPLAPGDYVHISVADTGTGIKAEHLGKIFDPYFTTKQQGSGLGLTTVYSIMRKHNGHIEVESELGRGTTFHLWLPARHEEQLDLPEDRVDVIKPLQGRVLFMDDEEPIVQMASMLLQRLGFEVELARDGSETVRKFAAAYGSGRPFDLVVMDLTVPGGMGGREAIEELRRIDPGVKAIVSSGYSSDPVLANYRAYGFRGMVAKPYKIDDFARVLREVMHQSRPPMPGALPGGPERK